MQVLLLLIINWYQRTFTDHFSSNKGEKSDNIKQVIRVQRSPILFRKFYKNRKDSLNPNSLSFFTLYKGLLMI